MCNQSPSPGTPSTCLKPVVTSVLFFDSNLTMSAQISNICKSVRYQLRNIGFIRKYLSRSATEKIVHALISSRLDLVTHFCIISLRASCLNYKSFKMLQLALLHCLLNVLTLPQFYNLCTGYQLKIELFSRFCYLFFTVFKVQPLNIIYL